jgi:protein arginine kinase
MTVDLTLLPDGGMSWLDASGPESHIVLSTRIRLARNLQGRPFTLRASRDDLQSVWDEVTAAAETTPGLRDAILYRIDALDPSDRALLHERHLISKELGGLDRHGGARPGAGLLTTGGLGVMINEEDHLRLQTLESGFALESAFPAIERLDTDLGARLPVAFHPEFGYLTACPTNAGTGLRASVLIHLPGLVLTKEIGKVLQGLSQIGLTFRGLYGEGSEVIGNFFQLSNQTTLGKSEEELVDHLSKMVGQVLEYEQQAREVLRREAPTVIEDKVWRAYGRLRYARILSFEETMNLLSGVRLGVGLNLISEVSVYTLNKLLIFTQPAHLAFRHGRPLADTERRVERARYVRDLLDADRDRAGR